MFKEILGDAFPIIEKVAPLIATALGGPAAGSAVSILETVFDGSIKEPKDLIERIIKDPQQADKLIKCNSIMNIGNGSLISLWESLGRPISLSIKWSEDKS